MTTSFADLGVPARMCEALAAQGMTEPFAVQAITLTDALAGRDLCGRAPTGSGKTLGFGIPLMARVSQAEPKRPTGLVLVPTRELAEQVQRAFVPLGRAQWRFVQAVYGGAPMSTQIHSLKKGASVVVATPGRLLDLIDQGHCDLSAVEVCVIDEADRMADLGFMPDVKRILDFTPSTRQTMLWSATLDGDVDELVRTYLREPAMHDLVGEVEQGDVEHRFVVHPATQRLDATVDLIGKHGPAIVFVKTRFGVDDVTAALMNAGVRAGSLHGARTQQARTRTLADFQRGKVQVLVATDVAARGIHVDDVDLVVHYDLPDNDKDYQHRSGRTGRAGRDGTVVAFVPPSRQRVARRLIDDLSHEVTWVDGDRSAPRSDRHDRTERPRSFDRDDRPRSFESRGGRDDRPAYGDRPRNDRNDRPAYGDRRTATARAATATIARRTATAPAAAVTTAPRTATARRTATAPVVLVTGLRPAATAPRRVRSIVCRAASLATTTVRGPATTPVTAGPTVRIAAVVVPTAMHASSGPAVARLAATIVVAHRPGRGSTTVRVARPANAPIASAAPPARPERAMPADAAIARPPVAAPPARCAAPAEGRAHHERQG
jgi:superfamily II DNA/RNA helicase